MATQTTNFTKPTAKKTSKLGLWFGKKHKLLLGYLLLLTIPFFATQMLDMDTKSGYAGLLSVVNTLAVMAFFVQFPLGSRLKQLPLFANIDWSIKRHKQIGKWIGVIFLLHPVFILAPRFLVSVNDGLDSAIKVLTAPQMLTGLIAWGLMIAWIILSIFKEKLPMRYETWRLMHVLGFVAITILVTLHLTSVGQHGQFLGQFNFFWWGLCGFSLIMVAYNYVIKPLRLKNQSFTLKDVSRVSSSDWMVTVESHQDNKFYFEPGQFVWLNTSASSYGVNQHPFSIASCQHDLPKISFIIRELGDYTSHLDSLTIGQQVYIDGPYGSMTLDDSNKAKGITLIAGGAGLGPMLSLLRGLAARNETRPIRLIYGNNRLDQMVLLEEIKALEQSMVNFKLQLVCQEKVNQEDIYIGVIDEQCIKNTVDQTQVDQWAVYLCGPKMMIVGVKKNLKALQVSSANVYYEQLSF
jgi:predicted ferric reductase